VTIATRDSLALEMQCEHCKGTGLNQDSRGTEYCCVWCHGEGEVLTDFGRSILILLRKYCENLEFSLVAGICCIVSRVSV
jgi:DnaJ-class molecular chaperone